MIYTIIYKPDSYVAFQLSPQPHTRYDFADSGVCVKEFELESGECNGPTYSVAGLRLQVHLAYSEMPYTYTYYYNDSNTSMTLYVTFMIPVVGSLSSIL